MIRINDITPSWVLLRRDTQRELDRLGIHKLSKAELARLHYNWQVHGDKVAYDTLYLYSVRLVLKIVSKMSAVNVLREGSSYDDAISNGIIGIANGLAKWNPNQSALTSYVWICIRQNILNENKKDWNRGLARHAPNAVLDLEWTYGGGMDFGSNMAAHKDRGDTSIDSEANPNLDAAEREEVGEVVSRELNPVQQKVISLLYTHDLTQQEVGDVLGLTQQRVDQLHQESLEVLKRVYL